jgi:hypothetical protein
MSIVAPIPDNLSDAQTEGILYNWYCCPKWVPLGAITAMAFDPTTPARAVVERDGLQLGELSRRLVLPRRIENWSLTSLQQRLVKAGPAGEARAVPSAAAGGKP